MSETKIWLIMGAGFQQNINGVIQEFRMAMQADIMPTITGAPALQLIEKTHHDKEINALKTEIAILRQQRNLEIYRTGDINLTDLMGHEIRCEEEITEALSKLGKG